MCELTPKDVKILEAAMNHVTYVEAAHSLGIDPRTYYTYLSRIRAKDRKTKRFQMRLRRYQKALYKRKEEEEEFE